MSCLVYKLGELAGGRHCDLGTDCASVGTWWATAWCTTGFKYSNYFIIIVVAILLSFSSFSILKLSLCQHTSFYLFKSLPCPTGGAGRREWMAVWCLLGSWGWTTTNTNCREENLILVFYKTPGFSPKKKRWHTLSVIWRNADHLKKRHFLATFPRIRCFPTGMNPALLIQMSMRIPTRVTNILIQTAGDVLLYQKSLLCCTKRLH